MRFHDCAKYDIFMILLHSTWSHANPLEPIQALWHISIFLVHTTKVLLANFFFSHCQSEINDFFHDFLRSGWNRKNRMKILENLDLENGDSKKNLFFLAWSHSAFSFSFFLVFKGAWKSRTHALQVVLDQICGVFKAFFWSHAFSKKTKPVLPDIWIQENNGFSYIPNGIAFHLSFCVAFKFNAFRFCFYWKAICEEL